jgi:Ca2+-binding EF-hand superfamily protein
VPLALGVITYLLLCGETPFGGLDGENLQIVKHKILRAQVSFEPEEKWELVSDEGKAFVKSLLNLDASKRPTAKEAQRCSWIQEWAKKDSKEGHRLSRETVEALISFKESSEMQKLLSEVLSFTLLPEQIVDLRKEFEKLDSHGDGEITLGSLKRILIQNAEVGALGALTEKEVEEIFESIKLPVRKAETTIRWHEFLAASLSQAKVDDRNLRLAFDRLDTQRKGFITFDDLSDILGNTTDYEALEKIWEESLSELNSRLDRITLDDFKKIMKGRPKEGMTAFLRSSPGLVPTLSDPDTIPGLSGFSLGLSDVVEEENESEMFEAPLKAENGVHESIEHSEASVFVLSDVEVPKTDASGPMVGSDNPPEDVSMRLSGLDLSAFRAGGPRLTTSLNPLSASEPVIPSAFSASSSMFSPLAANRHIYRQTLVRHSAVDATRVEVEERLRDMRNSKTNASLSMKRGTLFRGKSSD